MHAQGTPPQRVPPKKASANNAQPQPAPAKNPGSKIGPALQSLDEWVILRFRGVQLLPDSGVGGASPVGRSGAPRIETARTAARRDTLVALHFDTSFWQPAFSPGATVRFADHAGTVTSVAAQITARRAFRAPRKPGARNDHQEDWRVGWAYLVAMPLRIANAAPSGFNGWSIVPAPTKQPRTTP